MINRLYIAGDHNGWTHAIELTKLLSDKFEVTNLSNNSFDKDDDYPVFASKVAKAVVKDEESMGILICGSGQGMAMAANKFKGAKAGLAYNNDVVFKMRDNDNMNIVCLDSWDLSTNQCFEIINNFVSVEFNTKKRYVRRDKQINKLGQKID